MFSVQLLAITTLGSVMSPPGPLIVMIGCDGSVVSIEQLAAVKPPTPLAEARPAHVAPAPLPIVTVCVGSGQTEKYGVGYTMAFGSCTTEPQIVPVLPVSAVMVPLLLHAPTPARGEYRFPMTSTALPPTSKLPLVPTLPPVDVCVPAYVPLLVES